MAGALAVLKGRSSRSLRRRGIIVLVLPRRRLRLRVERGGARDVGVAKHDGDVKRRSAGDDVEVERGAFMSAAIAAPRR